MQVTEYGTPAPTAVRPRHITQFAFRTRVTDDIVAAMELAAMHDSTDAAPVQLAKAKQRAAMARVFAAQYLDLDSAELRAGFAGLPAEGVAAIFDTPVRDEERP